MGLAETYAAQGNYDKAIGLLQRELARTPDRLPIRLGLGNLAYRSGKYDLAIEQFEALVKKQPKDGDLYLRLGEAYRQKGDFDRAVTSYEKSKEINPNDTGASLRLALMLDGTGRKSEAKPIYEYILKLDPDNPIALNNLAYMMAESGKDLDEALTLAQRAKQKWPKDPNVADTLGWIYIKKNLTDNAVRIFTELVSESPEVSTYHYHLAMALFQKGDKAEAKKRLQIALQKKPSKDEEAKIKDLISRLG
jgi:tetratricopeptide (TPR) repeat protein